MGRETVCVFSLHTIDDWFWMIVKVAGRRNRKSVKWATMKLKKKKSNVDTQKYHAQKLNLKKKNSEITVAYMMISKTADLRWGWYASQWSLKCPNCIHNLTEGKVIIRPKRSWEEIQTPQFDPVSDIFLVADRSSFFFVPQVLIKSSNSVSADLDLSENENEGDSR